MVENMITIGCLMAEVVEYDSGQITSASADDVRLIYCHTTDSEDNKIIITSEMRQLGDFGHLPIAIARIDSNDPSQVFLRAVNGLSDGLLSALEDQWAGLVQIALTDLAGVQGISAISD